MHELVQKDKHPPLGIRPLKLQRLHANPRQVTEGTGKLDYRRVTTQLRSREVLWDGGRLNTGLDWRGADQLSELYTNPSISGLPESDSGT